MDPVSGTSLAGQTIITFSDYGKAVDIQAPEVVDRQDVTVGTGEDDHGDDPGIRHHNISGRKGKR